MKTLNTALLAAAFGILTTFAIAPESAAEASPGTKNAKTTGVAKASKSSPIRVAQATGKARTTKAKTKKKKIKKLVFDEGSDIDGNTVSPNSENMSARIFVTHSTLIRLRHDFLPEIHKSAEDL